MRGLLTVLLFLITVLAGGASRALDDAERAELWAAAEASPVRRLETWAAWMKRPLEARVGLAPAALLEYLRIDNRLLGYTGEPRASNNPRLRQRLRDALAGLPAEVLRLVEKQLAAIVIVRDLGSSGFTDVIYDQDGNPVGGFIVLDESVFSRRANAWASWRDSTVFRADRRYRIETRIARDSEDSRLVAVQYMLLHELAHVYTIGRDIHPPWGVDPVRYDLRDFAFTRLSWDIDVGTRGYRARLGSDFNLRKHIRFYREPALSAAEIPEVLSQLQQKPFVSLYAATRPEEDFAEAFTIYVHRDLLGRPYVSEAVVDGRVEVRFTPCFPDRCRQKYRFLQRLFQP